MLIIDAGGGSVMQVRKRDAGGGSECREVDQGLMRGRSRVDERLIKGRCDRSVEAY